MRDVFRLFLPLIAILAPEHSALAFQKLEPFSNALERRGLHHANLHGRVVLPTGEPAADVHVQLNGGAPRALPLADAVTGRDGGFQFHDINSEYMPDLRWYPPDGWMTGGMGIMAESAAEADVGTIRLQPDTAIRVAVEIVGQPPPGSRDPLLVLDAKGGMGRRIVGAKNGNYWMFHEIAYSDATLGVTLLGGERAEEYGAPIHIEQGRRDQVFSIRLLRDTLKVRNRYSSEGKAEVSEAILPPVGIFKTIVANGRVLAPDGSPLAGAYVVVNDFLLGRTRPAWAATDAQGRFRLPYQTVECAEPAVSYSTGDSFVPSFDVKGTPASCQEKWSTTQDLKLDDMSRLLVSVDGIDPVAARAFWWHDSQGWQPLQALRSWVWLQPYNDKRIKVEAEGFLPLVETLDVPVINRLSKEIPPENVPVAIHFDRSVERELTVRGNGAPLKDAIVDVETITDLDRDTRQPLATYRTPADGRLRLAGGKEELIEVFVYAGGFEPRRAIWDPGVPLTLELQARDATLTFAPSASNAVARVKDAGSVGGYRSVRLSATQPSTLRLPGGSYDVVLYGSRGAVSGYERLTAAQGSNTQIGPNVDQRPRLTVRYPPEGWHASVSESVPRGGATGWTAMISVGGAVTFTDIAATLERETSREANFVVSHAGKMHLELRKNGQSMSLWREIDLQPGVSTTVELATALGTLQGSMRTYTTETFSIHGFAGPRLELISDDPGGWSVTEYTPARENGSGGFTMRDIPAGSYHVYQHLIGETKTSDSEGRTYSYMSPIAAWGGIPVRIEAGQTAQLRDFIEYSYDALHVRVTDRTGKPLEHATVRIRDRMSEAWRQVEENPAQLEQAAYPIPYPAAARLEAGTATLPRVRPGGLELVVELDSGATYSFTAQVAAGQELRLSVPEDGTR